MTSVTQRPIRPLSDSPTKHVLMTRKEMAAPHGRQIFPN